MSDHAPVDAERLEQLLSSIPEDCLLDEAAAAEFRAVRQRIGARQRQWRDGMDALDPLFDDDGHRAKALAGNLATELEMLLVAWAAAASQAGMSERPASSQWITVTADAWCRHATSYGRLKGWDAEALGVFAAVLGDLRERGIRRAAERLRQPARSASAGFGGGGPLGAVGRLVERWFRPTVQGPIGRGGR